MICAKLLKKVKKPFRIAKGDTIVFDTDIQGDVEMYLLCIFDLGCEDYCLNEYPLSCISWVVTAAQTTLRRDAASAAAIAQM